MSSDFSKNAASVGAVRWGRLNCTAGLICTHQCDCMHPRAAGTQTGQAAMQSQAWRCADASAGSSCNRAGTGQSCYRWSHWHNVSLSAAVRGNLACSNGPGLKGSCAAQAIKAEDSVDQAPATLLREGVDSPDRCTNLACKGGTHSLHAKGTNTQAAAQQTATHHRLAPMFCCTHLVQTAHHLAFRLLSAKDERPFCSML